MIMTLTHRPGRAAILILTALAGCGFQEYDPHTPIGVHAGAIRNLGCLDVGVGLAPDPRIPRDELLLSLRVGNRCQHSQPFNAAAIRILAQTPEGDSVPLDLIDPRGEIGPRHLDASILASENIAIAGDIPAQRLVEICFDLAGVTPEEPSAPPEPLCLHRNGEGWAP